MSGRLRATLGATGRVLLALLPLLAGPPPAFAEAERFPRGHALGASAGFPSLLNLEYSYEFGGRAVYLSGAYLGRAVHGVQAGLGLGRNGTARKHSSVNLIAGTFAIDFMRDEPETWTYGGFEGHLQYRSFFIAPAFTFGDGSLGDETDYSVGETSNSNEGPRYFLLVRLGFIAPLRPAAVP